MTLIFEDIRVGDILRCIYSCDEDGEFRDGCIYEVSAIENDRIYCYDRDDDEEYIVDLDNWEFHSKIWNSDDKAEKIEEINTKPNKDEIKVYKQGSTVILTDKDGDSVTMSKETFKLLK